MKITVGRLKRLINEALKPESVDLVATTDPKAAQNAWPNVTWNGHDIVDEIYPAALAALESSFSKTPGVDVQEVYLGYVQGDDSFVMGWDMWIQHYTRHGDADEADFVSAYKHFKVSTSLQIVPLDGGQGATGFYRSGDPDSGYAIVHEKYPTIIDLRLD